ncbi:hypothetical protein Dimus_035115 [Dionaea muscipula]
MEFEKRKAATLAAMASSEPDKSPKGSLDTPIIPLLKTLNHHSSYFTTSSCSGRISIFSHPTTTAAVPKPKKSKGGSWIYITHEPADPNSVISMLFPTILSTQSEPTHPPSELVFRFEPFIVAVECKDVGSAQFLVSLAISSGFRESGITGISAKRVIVAIRCSIRLEVPLGSSGRIMVSEEYVRYLVELANGKMTANRRRTDGFLEALRHNGFTEPEAEVGRGEVLLNGVVRNGGVDINDEECKVGYDHGEGHEGNANPDRAQPDTCSGSLNPHGTGVPIVRINVARQPMERLYLWGHSSCTLGSTNQKKLLVFGGFGGVGRHARRNDCLLLDPSCGTLDDLSIKGGPSPRLGHTCLLVGELMFVLGGRADPVNILNDVWILHSVRNEWKFVDCSSSAFAPRHRHAAAVLGSKIYLFGGLNNDTIYSSLLVLDADKLHWNEVHASGEWPCARHSHTLVAHGSKLYMFGGHNGEKALGDLYSFDVEECRWEKVKTVGRAPYPRFSHSMFAYRDYIAIIGGCPVRQHFQELALLDLQTYQWKHVMLNSEGNDLFVRSTANVVGDDLIMIGGGASCYAFGTKFNEPVKIELFRFLTWGDTLTPTQFGARQGTHHYEQNSEKRHGDVGVPQEETVQSSDECPELGSDTKRDDAPRLYWVLQLHKKYAKPGKDLLKKFGWLDLGRKVYTHEDRLHICFPVTEHFCAIFPDKISQTGGGPKLLIAPNLPISFTQRGVSISEVSSSTALSLLLACGASKLAQKVAEKKKTPRSPADAMRDAVGTLIENKGLPARLLSQLPTRWERLGDIVVLPITSFDDPIWKTMGDELWPVVAKSLGARRLAHQGRVAANGTRDSGLEILVGDNGWVEHCENGILYSFDATKCMFSWGNLSEKIRMARVDCKDEVIVDLFAGIGYFVLPFLVRYRQVPVWQLRCLVWALMCQNESDF